VSRRRSFHYDKSVNRPAHAGPGASAHFKDATSLEEAVFADKKIRLRKQREDREQQERNAKSRVTLSPSLDAWLKKEVPE
jgi:hypothetical protein